MRRRTLAEIFSSNIGDEVTSLRKTDEDRRSQFLSSLVEEGWQRYKEGYLEESKKLFEKAMYISPFDDNIRVLLGKVCIRMGDVDEAVKLFRESKELAPQNVVSDILLAIVHQNSGDKELALSIIREAIRRQQDRPNNLYIGIYEYFQGNYHKSRLHFESYIKSDGDDMSAHLMMSMVLFRTHQYRQAKEHCLRFITYFPNDPLALNILGSIEFKLREYSSAAKHFAIAVRLAPSVDLYRKLFWTHLRCFNVLEAIKTFSSAVKQRANIQ